MLYWSRCLIGYIINPKILYVDNGVWDGTIGHIFRYIQGSIDHANPGDTIFVYNGSYGRSYNSIVI